ncbi:MAG TPA: radical SAM protein [bacterium]|nr:radical SAM protein [bacterium]HNS48361.1 radical SAM protein [bacterium]
MRLGQQAREKATGYAATRTVKAILALMPRISNTTLIRLTHLAELLVADTAQKERVRVIREKFERNHPSLEAAKRIARRLSVPAREKLIHNLVVNGMLLGTRRRNSIRESEGWRPPFFIVISPTMRCNLNCIGCYAGSYERQDVLASADLDRILNQARELGIYFVTISGGEPFMREDLLDLMQRHNDIYFQVYTNGTLITDRVADRLAALGNVAPAISVEGYQAETDHRRGTGVYRKLEQVWKKLVEKGVMFGFSATPTRHNLELLFSDGFIDSMIEAGALFGWYFHYIPIGSRPDVNLMPTPEQRAYARERVNDLRNRKPIILADFWNDGHLTGGCIAGGRTYLHINANGDVEPCVFVHFAIDNIRERSLREAINSPLMRAIQKRQPYSPNLMTPCMIIDQPWVLREVVRETGAHDTDHGGRCLLHEINGYLDNYSRSIHGIFDPIWDREYGRGRNLRIKYDHQPPSSGAPA